MRSVLAVCAPLLLLLGAPSCSGKASGGAGGQSAATSSSTTGGAAGSGGFTSQSVCGHPGDKGNSLGVGQFCQQLSDCSNNAKATICTSIASNDAFFCTFACTKGGPADQCGADAACSCGAGGCGCEPTKCLNGGSTGSTTGGAAGGKGQAGASGAGGH